MPTLIILPADCGGFFGTSTSLMETSTALLLHRQRGEGNLCDVLQTSEIALPCVHVHAPTSSIALTDRRKNPPAEGWDAGAAFLCDVRVGVLED